MSQILEQLCCMSGRSNLLMHATWNTKGMMKACKVQGRVSEFREGRKEVSWEPLIFLFCIMETSMIVDVVHEKLQQISMELEEDLDCPICSLNTIKSPSGNEPVHWHWALVAKFRALPYIWLVYFILVHSFTGTNRVKGWK